LSAYGNEVEPIFLEGLTPGKHAVSLELVDKDGKVVQGPPGYETYNTPSQQFDVQ